MYQNIMIGVVAVFIALVALRIYQSWEKEKALKSSNKTRSGPKKTKSRSGPSMSAEPFHCVTIVGGCEALETYKGKRFLASSAPPLPVPECTAGRCNCHYTHHSDRRKPNEDRRTLGRLADEQYTLSGHSERRESHGRRKSDGSWATIDEWSNAL